MTSEPEGRPLSFREWIEASFGLLHILCLTMTRGLSGKGFSFKEAHAELAARIEAEARQHLEAHRRHLERRTKTLDPPRDD